MIYRNYSDQTRTWPQAGRHILAQFDDESIWVYQAYRPAIADYAVAHQRFGDEFSFSRMSWIKPNFLWMMYRSGWGTKEGQERVLAIRLRRAFFEDLLCAAVPSSFSPGQFPEREDWERAVADSEVRLQWDPDHDPAGTPLQRRALQLRLRGAVLRRYATTEIHTIEDITSFAVTQGSMVQGNLAELLMPEERVYLPTDIAIHKKLGLDEYAGTTLGDPT